LVRQVAAATHIPVIDLNAPMQGRPEDFPDDVHPNKEGQARMAQVVYAYLTGQPVILPAGGLFVHPVRVSLVPTAPSRNIRYTLDGTSPTLTSIPYTSPFVIAQGCTVKSSEFGANGKAGSFTSSDFSIVPPLAASQPDGPSPGLSYSFYHNSSDNALGDPAKLTADETGTVLDPGNLPHSGEGDCGFLLSGYIKVPTTGVYSFWVGSYATSIIYIDDIKVAESGGVKGFHLHTAETGSIGLAAGLHKIAVVYSQVDGAETGLALRYVGPGVPLQSIPAAELSH
jgi:hexosaminidase